LMSWCATAKGARQPTPRVAAAWRRRLSSWRHALPADRVEASIRVIVNNPVQGLTIALQRGSATKATLVPPTEVSSDSMKFEFEVTAAGRLANGKPRLLGPFVQGPPEARFVYLCVGRY